ncbi:MAG: 2,4-dienoyl-CoA reductase [Gammaproteobacteria bacterium]|nr:MAG: 2,4-dienoyl-CoA reductase [Gammaproteobacteria bacterium]
MIQSIYKQDLFKDKVVLVTGGGSGIGLRITKELLFLGAHVVIAGRNEEKLNLATEALQDYRHQLSTVSCNIREEQQVDHAVDKILSQHNQIDFLVNNAGGQFPQPADQMKIKGWRAVIDTNLNGTFIVSQKIYKQSMKRTGGAIVNILANMWNGFPDMCHTGAARAGVENLTKTLATEWGPEGVRINSVAPGVIRSSGFDTYDEDFTAYLKTTPKDNKAYRFGTEAEVAAAVLFLLSPAANFITGETIKVDGGEPLYSPKFPHKEHGKMAPWDGTGKF